MEQGEPYWNPLVPELTVADLENSLRFYLACGFSMRFRRSNPPFAYLELGKAQLMLEQQHAEGWNVEPLDRPLGRGTNFQIEVPDAEAVLSALRSLGVRPYRGVKDTWYVPATLLESGASLVGYEFASKYWRQGIGSASIDAMLTELALSYDVHTFVAVLESANYRSLGLLHHLGFKPGTAEDARTCEAADNETVLLKAAGSPLPPHDVAHAA